MELDKLKQILADVLHTDTAYIKEDTTFVDDLGADSLDLFQIVMCVEELYDIEIDSRTAEQIRTVGDAVEAIRRMTE